MLHDASPLDLEFENSKQKQRFLSSILGKEHSINITDTQSSLPLGCIYRFQFGASLRFAIAISYPPATSGASEMALFFILGNC
jgi:hypothetical protein